MPSIIDQMTEIYCFVDDFLKVHIGLAGWRRSPNPKPPFADAEVITIGLMQSFLGVASLKQTYDLIADNFARPSRDSALTSSGFSACTGSHR